MKSTLRRTVLLGGVALGSLLTACVPTPTPPMATVFTFRFPSTPVSPNLTLAAIYFEESATPGGDAQLKVLNSNRVGYQTGDSISQADLYLYNPASLINNPKCVTPFLGGETKGMSAVTVTPDTVKTCNLYFSLFNDTNGDGAPSSSEELYTSNDIYSYATSAFTYAFTSSDGKSTETGTRTQGWSLVRHQVIQPSATPGKYKVTMNSAPTSDNSMVIRLHEATDRLTSQSLGGTP